MAVPKKKTSKAKGRSRKAAASGMSCGWCNGACEAGLPEPAEQQGKQELQGATHKAEGGHGGF